MIAGHYKMVKMLVPQYEPLRHGNSIHTQTFQTHISALTQTVPINITTAKVWAGSSPRTVPGAIGGRSVPNSGDFLVESSCCISGCWPRRTDADAALLSWLDICSVDVLDELSQQQHEALPFSTSAGPAHKDTVITTCKIWDFNSSIANDSSASTRPCVNARVAPDISKVLCSFECNWSVGDAVLQNVVNHSPNNTAWHSRRL